MRFPDPPVLDDLQPGLRASQTVLGGSGGILVAGLGK